MRFVVLDDDPTGVQSLTGVPVVLDWSGDALARVGSASSVHLLTNSRALDPAAALAVSLDAARAGAAAFPGAVLVARGDSTLRGHVREEYEAIREVAFAGADVPLLLAMALPSAGRVTAGGVHYLVRDHRRIPVAETEYARDPMLGYASSELAAWAAERSSGRFGRGVAASAATLAEAVRAQPEVIALDAQDDDDVIAGAAAIRALLAAGTRLNIRCSPAFAGALEGTSASALVAPPSARRLLVVSGSYVSRSRRQLVALARRHPGVALEVDAKELSSADAEAEIARVATRAQAHIDRDGLAVVATPAYDGTLAVDSVGHLVARGLAAIARRVDADVVVSKGGVASAVVARHGLGAPLAWVEGPVAVGVAAWRCETPTGPRTLLVVPGNVGDDELLADVVDLVRG